MDEKRKLIRRLVNGETIMTRKTNEKRLQIIKELIEEGYVVKGREKTDFVFLEERLGEALLKYG
jgi:hypothetical protein